MLKRNRSQHAPYYEVGAPDGSSSAPAVKRARRAHNPAAFEAALSGAHHGVGDETQFAQPRIFVKVGNAGRWFEFNCDDDVLGMHRTRLLKALKHDRIFGGYLREVIQLGGCAVLLLKGSPPAWQRVPNAAVEAIASNFVELVADMSVSDAAQEGKCSGGRLFIFVRTPSVAGGSAPPPGTAAAHLHAALIHAKLEAIEGEPAGGCELLSLYDSTGKRVDWPHLRSNKLLVRPVYREFFERPDMLNRGKPRSESYGIVDSLVWGIPGIGTSSFALYCLWRLVVLEKRHVLYDYPKFMEMEVTLEFGSGDRSEAVYIADDLEPRRDAASSCS